MDAENLEVRLGLRGNFWDRRPEYRVSFNGVPVAHNHFSLSNGEVEYIDFTIENTEEYGVLSVELLNKRPTDTVENADKTGILNDMTLDIASLTVDDIVIDSILHSASEYRPEYPPGHEGDPVLLDYVTLGWNGVWSIRWTNPFYLWLLDTL